VSRSAAHTGGEGYAGVGEARDVPAREEFGGAGGGNDGSGSNSSG
jgi:hypothetical protein